MTKPPEGQELVERREPMSERWILLFLRLTQIITFAWIAMELPLPALGRGLFLKGPVIALVTVILIGKAIYDTFFYERYQP